MCSLSTCYPLLSFECYLFNGALHAQAHTQVSDSSGDANPAARPAARNLGDYHATGDIAPFANRTFEWGVAIVTLLSNLEYCTSPLCLFDLFPSSKIEGNQYDADYPETNPPSPMAPAVRRKCSLCCVWIELVPLDRTALALMWTLCPRAQCALAVCTTGWGGLHMGQGGEEVVPQEGRRVRGTEGAEDTHGCTHREQGGGTVLHVCQRRLPIPNLLAGQPHFQIETLAGAEPNVPGAQAHLSIRQLQGLQDVLGMGLQCREDASLGAASPLHHRTCSQGLHACLCAPPPLARATPKVQSLREATPSVVLTRAVFARTARGHRG